MSQTGESDYYWVGTDEPHATRRRLILEKHPEIKELYGHNPWTGFFCVVIFAGQTLAAYLLRNASWSSIVLTAYLFGGFLNHSATLAMHELSHNLAFKQPYLNKIFGYIVNCPLALPSAITFKRYHLEHHMHQGVEGIDMDIPSSLETKYLNNIFGKIFFVFFQVLFYAFRPVMVKPKPRTPDEWMNTAIAIAYDYWLVDTFGWRSLAYLMLCNVIGLGCHPMAAHFIAEHYVFVKGYETYSYYGPLNYLSFFVGYHNEHHDFPKIPGSSLHKVREIAPEFYDNLPRHHSWTRVIFEYLRDSTVGPFSRVKRHSKSALSGVNKTNLTEVEKAD